MWPENWIPFKIFNDASTQWRFNSAGATGLEYSTLKWLMELYGVEKSDELDMLHRLRTLEITALGVVRSK